MKYLPYLDYVDSGLPWFGFLPAHWSIHPVKRRFQVRLGKMLDQVPADPPLSIEMRYLRAANIQDESLHLVSVHTMRFSATEQSRFSLRAGDMLVVEGGSIGTNQVLTQDMPHLGYQNSINRVRAQRGDYCKIVGYQLRVLRDLGILDMLTNKSTIAHLTAEKLAAISIVLPPVSEQRQILEFLDRETAQIDELIAKQNALIELLAERRRAVITAATERGLTPSASLMKPSKTPWYGDVPLHWKVQPLRRSLLVLTSGSRGWGEYYADSGDTFIRVGNLPLVGSKLQMQDRQYVEVPSGAEGSRTKTRAGDVLLSITGANLGKVAVVEACDEDAFVSQHVALVRLDKRRLAPAFFGYVLQSEPGQRQVREFGYSGLKPQLSLGEVGAFVHTLPPLAEQLAIVDFLDDATKRNGELTSKAKQVITLLQERRSALITAAVTGKIDVRGEV